MDAELVAHTPAEAQQAIEGGGPAICVNKHASENEGLRAAFARVPCVARFIYVGDERPTMLTRASAGLGHTLATI
jgi:hypothetical protein